MNPKSGKAVSMKSPGAPTKATDADNDTSGDPTEAGATIEKFNTDTFSSTATMAPADKHVLQMAGLAKDVYNDEGAPPGWERLSPDEMPKELGELAGSDDFQKRAERSGLDYAVYRSEDTGEHVIAFRGTEGVNPFSSASRMDWGANIRQALGYKSEQHQLAQELASAAAESGTPFETTGHSLGGGLAALAGATADVPATTFNPASISDSTLKRAGIDPANASDKTKRYVVKGEVLDRVQRGKAQGERIDLDPNAGPTKRGTVGKHGMDAVIESLEARPASSGAYSGGGSGGGNSGGVGGVGGDAFGTPKSNGGFGGGAR